MAFSDFGRNDNMAIYTMEDVAKHATKEDRIWVTYTDGVYDITDYYEKHPGGDVILASAGSSMDQEFNMYPFHKKGSILKELEALRIGSLTQEDKEKNLKKKYDPYARDPKFEPTLKVHSIKPLFAEPKSTSLVENFITPTNLLFVRNHLPVPMIDITYSLKVCGVGINEHIFTFMDIKEKFPKHTVLATMECAGNRRSEMNKVRTVKGLIWELASITNSLWTGVLLSDLLKYCGFEKGPEGGHIQFEGMDLDPTKVPYGASVPIEKVDPAYEIVIAYEVNGEPLPMHNGYPLRVIAPGVCGARCVKWLAKIIVSTEESQSLYQQKDYKGFAPSVTWDTVVYESAPAVQEMPVTSVICNLADKQRIRLQKGQPLLVKGYAYSGGGCRIIRVDVTADCGQNWRTADLINEDGKTSLIRCWTWSLWQIEIPLDPTIVKQEVELWVKAVDSSYNTQPESFANIWNYGGVVCNAYHRIKVTVIQQLV